MAVLLVLVMFNNTAGSAVPLLKKPLDAVEFLVVNNAALPLALLPVVYHESACKNRRGDVAAGLAGFGIRCRPAWR